MYYLSDICSLCLVVHQNVKSILLPDTDGSVIEEKLRLFLSELIHFRPNIPKYICNKCLLDLNCIYKIILRWLENTTKLKTYVHKLEVQGSYTNLSVTLTDTKYEKRNESGTYLKKNDIQEKKLHSDGTIKSEFNEYGNTDCMRNDNQITSSKEVKIEIKESNLIFLDDNVKEEHENVNYQTPYEIFEEFNDEKDIIESTVSTHLEDDDHVSEAELFEHNGSDDEYLPSNASFSATSEASGSDVDKAETQAPHSNKSEHASENLSTMNKNKEFKQFIPRTKYNHAGTKPYKCDVCGKAFNKKFNLIRHKRTHTCEKPFKCHDCGKSFNYKCVLITHKLTHTGEKPFKCDVCDNAFSQKNNLITHKRAHTGERPFKCDDCGKSFNYKCALITHKLTHTGEKPFKCDVCDKAFSQKNNLITHKRAHTSERSFKCDDCGKSFRNKCNLITHKLIHTGEKPFKCAVCDKALSSLTHLIRHKRTHTGERPFKCDVCDKAFSQKFDLITHKRTHTGEKPFKCDFCGKAFNQKGNLIKHKLTHTGEKPFKCDFCGKAFNQKGNLITHKLTHTGEKPFKCDVCDKAFSHKINLITHKRTHTGEKPFKCDTPVKINK